MGDVFGGLAGAHGPGVDPDALEPVLHGAAWWGAELDTRYRVLALTFEPTADRYPWGPTSDRRIQLLCHPVSTVLATLVRAKGDTRELLTFDEGHLVDVVAVLGGAQVRGPLFGHPEPRPGEWGPDFSMQGRSTAGDGTAHTVRLAASHDDLDLKLFARFDVVEVRDATGEVREDL